MKHSLILINVAVALVLSGCMNAGDDLADRSRVFGKCQLEKAEAFGTGQLDESDICGVALPAGSEFGRATVAYQNDAVRITSPLQNKADCESYVDRADALPGIMIQVIVNDTVVRPYNGPPVPDAIKTACASGPYIMKMIVAKAL